MNKEVIKFVIKDKPALALLAVLGVVTIIVTILLFVWIRPSDIQIPIRYSGYDYSQQFYIDRWYERLSFVGFLLLQTLATAVLSMLMFARGYKVLAYFMLALGIFVAVIVAIVASAVTRTVTL